MTLAEQLQGTVLFKGVDPRDVEALLKVMQRRTYPPGAVLFERGSVGDEMFIILAGRIRIYTYDEYGNELTLRHYGQNDIFGELSPLDQGTRSASAAAAEPLEVLVLNRENLLSFLQDRPSVGLAMMRALASRVRYTTDYLTKVMEWVHRLSKGEYEATIQEIAQTQRDSDIENLISSFVQMVHTMQAREQNLKEAQDALAPPETGAASSDTPDESAGVSRETPPEA